MKWIPTGALKHPAVTGIENDIPDRRHLVLVNIVQMLILLLII